MDFCTTQKSVRLNNPLKGCLNVAAQEIGKVFSECKFLSDDLQQQQRKSPFETNKSIDYSEYQKFSDSELMLVGKYGQKKSTSELRSSRVLLRKSTVEKVD